MFQHTAARRRLRGRMPLSQMPGWFQHTAARRRLRAGASSGALELRFNTQPPEGGCFHIRFLHQALDVSTHSRPKAAAEGGHGGSGPGCDAFQHTAARRRLPASAPAALRRRSVSTHSRPKAAAQKADCDQPQRRVSTHSRPKAAASVKYTAKIKPTQFQHTAARRRLLAREDWSEGDFWVSTHSRPKAAALAVVALRHKHNVSTHSRPKAAAQKADCDQPQRRVSTHSRPKAAAYPAVSP